jgi:hypothetical protein
MIVSLLHGSDEEQVKVQVCDATEAAQLTTADNKKQTIWLRRMLIRAAQCPN